jgi:outer membrane protein OmpA-like peptidoglycan-associated protein
MGRRSLNSILSAFGIALIASTPAVKAASPENAGLSRYDAVGAPVSVEALEDYRLVKLKRVYFASRKSDLSVEEEISLSQFVSRFCRTNQFVIELRGYADDAGSADHGLALSTRRAEAIAQYLTKSGILPQRIRLIGLGEIDANRPTDNPEHQRVDIRIFANPETVSNGS